MQFRFDRVRLRLVGSENFTAIRELKASLIGQFVALQGTVVRLSSVKPFVMQIVFTCNTCQETVVHMLEDGKYSMPSKCPREGCKSHHFTIQRDHEKTLTVDSQRLKLQEKLSDASMDTGRVPRRS
jgi:DNA helicase MCM8